MADTIVFDRVWEFTVLDVIKTASEYVLNGRADCKDRLVFQCFANRDRHLVNDITIFSGARGWNNVQRTTAAHVSNPQTFFWLQTNLSLLRYMEYKLLQEKGGYFAVASPTLHHSGRQQKHAYVLKVVAVVTVYRNDLGPPEALFDTRTLFRLVLATNLLVTALTVGRIWWTRRDLRAIGRTKFIERYNIAMAMMLEASALYCLCISILLVALSFRNVSETGSPLSYVSYGFGGQLVNIIPALLIVRVSLSRSIDMDSAMKPSKLSPV
ncbi:hypothetical protein FB451DRAFT_1374263 [Mycena latifolia]|nr:hypothetical protein FB451DRAFT_1374263 [Mycena latifolia]